MRILVAVTDTDWYEFLRSRTDLDEANFWQPSGSSTFRALGPGELMLFKLHAPRNHIVGGGFFSYFQVLPYRMAWNFFGPANGAPSMADMRRRIARYRKEPDEQRANFKIGCIMLTDIFFFEQADWIPVPEDFAPNIVRYKGYSLQEPAGKQLWDEVQLRLRSRVVADRPARHDPTSLYSDPVTTRRRLGQGSFRALVADTYEWRCAMTGEKAHPVLEAAHIVPVGEGGRHEVGNGLLLRSDVHHLFDDGYITVTPDYQVRVSGLLKEEFDNGEPYYPLRDQRIWLPPNEDLRPVRDYLDWHGQSVFKG